MIYSHYSIAPWDKTRWPNFTAKEFSCSHCGEFYYWPEYFERIQWVRTALGRPVRINSAHRCVRHNLAVGGAPMSEHKKIATDLSLRGQDRYYLASLCKAAGFKGFGYYNTFLHVDLGRKRFWYGGELSQKAWS